MWLSRDSVCSLGKPPCCVRCMEKVYKFSALWEFLQNGDCDTRSPHDQSLVLWVLAEGGEGIFFSFVGSDLSEFKLVVEFMNNYGV